MEKLSNLEITSFLIALWLVSVIILFKLISPKKRWSPGLPPGPTAFPVVGSLPQMLWKKPAFRWILNLMEELKTEIACIKLGGVHVIVVTSPEVSREFLKKHDAVLASRPDVASARLISDGFLTVAMSPSGDQWQKMRRIMASEVLTNGVFRRLHAKRSEEADHLVTHLYKRCLMNGEVHLRDATRHYCANVIRKMVFGRRSFGPGMEDGGPGLEEREHVDALFNILSCLYGFAVADFVPCLEFLDLDGHKSILRNAIQNVRKYQDAEIDKRMEMWKRGIKTQQDDILDLLINLKNSQDEPLLSPREIKAQILEIMIATVDNPSNAAEWALVEMIKQPELLGKACEELDRIVGKERVVEESDLPKLNYVKACLKEAFRLHPIAPFNVPHISSEDTIVGGYLIPKKSYVVLSRVGLGRNPRVWDEPLRFKPERHINEEVSLADHDLRILSFSTGRRGCPGVMLGSTIATMLLARLIQGFRWTPPLHTNTIHLPLIAHATPRLDSQIYLQLMPGN